MKRKIIALLLSIISVLSIGCFLFGCGDDVAELQTDEKYIHCEDVGDEESKQRYYIFHSDGTGEYRFYNNNTYNHTTVDYIIKFKYTYVDGEKSAVACFYDSIEYGAAHTNTKFNESDWNELVNVSENVVCTVGSSGYLFFVNENYLSEIPNYDKKNT